MRATKPKGRIIVIGFASGDVPSIPANIILVKNIDIIGFYWGGYLKFAPRTVMQSIAALMEMYTSGQLKPHISHTLPLDQAGEALDLLRTRTSTGKVVVTLS
jgi:NADPH2:quinone reductase